MKKDSKKRESLAEPLAPFLDESIELSALADLDSRLICPRVRNRKRNVMAVLQLYLFILSLPISIFGFVASKRLRRFVLRYIPGQWFFKDYRLWPVNLNSKYVPHAFLGFMLYFIVLSAINLLGFIIDGPVHVTRVEIISPFTNTLLIVLTYALRFEEFHRRSFKHDENLSLLRHLLAAGDTQTLRERSDIGDTNTLFWAKHLLEKPVITLFLKSSSRVYDMMKGLPTAFAYMCAFQNLEMTIERELLDHACAKFERKKAIGISPEYLKLLREKVRQGEVAGEKIIKIPLAWVAFNYIFRKPHQYLFHALITFFTLSFTLISVIPSVIRWQSDVSFFAPSTFATTLEFFYFYDGIVSGIVCGYYFADAINQIWDEGTLITSLGDIVFAFNSAAEHSLLQNLHRKEVRAFDGADDDAMEIIGETLLPPANLETVEGVKNFSLLFKFGLEIRRGIQQGSTYVVVVILTVSGIMLVLFLFAIFVTHPGEAVQALQMPSDAISLSAVIWVCIFGVTNIFVVVIVVSLICAFQNVKLKRLRNALTDASTLLELRSAGTETPDENPTAEKDPCAPSRSEMKEAATMLTRLSASVDTNPVSLLGIPLTFATVSTLISLSVAALSAFIRFVRTSATDV